MIHRGTRLYLKPPTHVVNPDADAICGECRNIITSLTGSICRVRDTKLITEDGEQ